MKRTFRCPRCLSLIEFKGIYDPNVSYLQKITCPVCFQEFWLDSRIPPHRWEISAILERREPKIARYKIEEVPEWMTKEKASITFPEAVSKSITEGVQKISEPAKNLGIWIIIVLLLLIILFWR